MPLSDQGCHENGVPARRLQNGEQKRPRSLEGASPHPWRRLVPPALV
jgi:hypothetical protein